MLLQSGSTVLSSFSPAHSVDGDFSLGLLLTADHARRDVPAEYGTLGLQTSEFDRHIAYDIGVENLTAGAFRWLASLRVRFSTPIS